VAIALVGLGGAVANSLLLEENSLIVPAIRTEAGRRKVDLGFLSNVALGIAAAFATPEPKPTRHERIRLRSRRCL